MPFQAAKSMPRYGIPWELTERTARCSPRFLERNDRGQDRVLIDGGDLVQPRRDSTDQRSTAVQWTVWVDINYDTWQFGVAG
jgi:hypothetical protein